MHTRLVESGYDREDRDAGFTRGTYSEHAPENEGVTAGLARADERVTGGN